VDFYKSLVLIGSLAFGLNRPIDQYSGASLRAHNSRNCLLFLRQQRNTEKYVLLVLLLNFELKKSTKKKINILVLFTFRSSLKTNPMLF
jgi:hypothetical protein